MKRKNIKSSLYSRFTQKRATSGHNLRGLAPGQHRSIAAVATVFNFSGPVIEARSPAPISMCLIPTVTGRCSELMRCSSLLTTSTIYARFSKYCCTHILLAVLTFWPDGWLSTATGAVGLGFNSRSHPTHCCHRCTLPLVHTLRRNTRSTMKTWFLVTSWYFICFKTWVLNPHVQPQNPTGFLQYHRFLTSQSFFSIITS